MADAAGESANAGRHRHRSHRRSAFGGGHGSISRFTRCSARSWRASSCRPIVAFARAFASRFKDLLAVLLLPLFFARAGLRTDLRGLAASADWIACLAVVAVAVVSKIGGGMFGARAMGATWRNASALGILMNARGLMELVLLTIGSRRASSPTISSR
jgi:hypothetical protein